MKTDEVHLGGPVVRMTQAALLWIIWNE